MKHCCICAELQRFLGTHRDAGQASRAARWPINKDSAPRFVISTDQFVAMPTIGPIAIGHCLIVPREHRLSMGNLSLGQRNAAIEVLGALSERLRRVFSKPVIMFEHGAPDDSDLKPCSIGHAHWHIVPSNVKVEAMLVEGFSWTPVSNPFVNAERPYLFVSGDDGAWVAYPESEIPSQILRQRLAMLEGCPEDWDWRASPNYDRVHDSLALLV